jgi:hypothetical protein
VSPKAKKEWERRKKTKKKSAEDGAKRKTEDGEDPMDY